MAPLAQGFAEERSQLVLPLPYGFMRKAEAPLEKHFGEVPQAQLGAEAPQDDQADYVCRILQPIEGCPSPLVKPPLTVRQRKRRYPNSVRSERSVVAVDSQCEHVMGSSSFQRYKCTWCAIENEGGVRTDRTVGNAAALIQCAVMNASAVIVATESPRMAKDLHPLSGHGEYEGKGAALPLHTLHRDAAPMGGQGLLYNI
jgi:hypothetical protein